MFENVDGGRRTPESLVYYKLTSVSGELITSEQPIKLILNIHEII